MLKRFQGQRRLLLSTNRYLKCNVNKWFSRYFEMQSSQQYFQTRTKMERHLFAPFVQENIVFASLFCIKTIGILKMYTHLKVNDQLFPPHFARKIQITAHHLEIFLIWSFKLKNWQYFYFFKHSCWTTEFFGLMPTNFWTFMVTNTKKRRQHHFFCMSAVKRGKKGTPIVINQCPSVSIDHLSIPLHHGRTPDSSFPP